MSLRSAERWPDAACPTPIEYSKPAFEQLRRLAVAALEALPRVGLGIGGLLLGTREGDQISILDSFSIPCTHAGGPGFALTSDELAYAMDVVNQAGPLLVVGWYCSKPRGGSLGDADLAVWARLCPDAWQIALVLRPQSSGDSLASICFRNADGNLVPGKECPLEPSDVTREQVSIAVAKALRPVTALKMALQSEPPDPL
jgi:hypothetical protein